MPIEDEPTVWMRSIAWHTYLGVPQEIGAYYLAHEDIVETIADVLHFAVRDTPPPRAVRTMEAAPISTPVNIPVPTHTPIPVTPPSSPAPPPAPTPAPPAPEPQRRRLRPTRRGETP